MTGNRAHERMKELRLRRQKLLVELALTRSQIRIIEAVTCTERDEVIGCIVEGGEELGAIYMDVGVRRALLEHFRVKEGKLSVAIHALEDELTRDALYAAGEIGVKGASSR